MQKIFNERAFLVRALMGVFILQFITVGYQTYSCQSAIKSDRESDKVTVICQNATTSFNETSKLALTTFLALLVPAAAQTTSTSKPAQRKKPESGESTEG